MSLTVVDRTCRRMRDCHQVDCGRPFRSGRATRSSCRSPGSGRRPRTSSDRVQFSVRSQELQRHCSRTRRRAVRTLDQLSLSLRTRTAIRCGSFGPTIRVLNVVQSVRMRWHRLRTSSFLFKSQNVQYSEHDSP